MLHKLDEIWGVVSHYILGIYGLCVAVGLEIYNRGDLAMDGVLEATAYLSVVETSSGFYLLAGKYYYNGVPLLETLQVLLAVLSIFILIARGAWDLYRVLKQRYGNKRWRRRAR